MDPVSIWGAVISIITATGATFAGGAWRTLGKIEGKTEDYGRRLDEHSDVIEGHSLTLVRIPDRLDDLVRQLEDVRQQMSAEHAELSKGVQRLHQKVKEIQLVCPRVPRG